MSNTRFSNGKLGPTAISFKSHETDSVLESFLWRLLLLTALAYFIWSDSISIHIGPLSIQKTAVQRQLAQRKSDLLDLLGFGTYQDSAVKLEERELDNLTFAIDPTYAARFGIGEEVVHQRMEQCSLFVKRFNPVAIAEMRRYGVPASILLAQALLASNAGECVLALESNNFFLRPCVSPSCTAEHLLDSDASEVPLVVDVFPNLWESFRSQSLYLRQTAPFSNLFQSCKKNYSTWAEGLAKAGYSNDSLYGKKLCAIIQTFQLDAFDGR